MPQLPASQSLCLLRAQLFEGKRNCKCAPMQKYGSYGIGRLSWSVQGCRFPVLPARLKTGLPSSVGLVQLVLAETPGTRQVLRPSSRPRPHL